MLTLSGAHGLIEKHLADPHRRRHSIMVGDILAEFASVFGAEPLVWELTGLCHDLDIESINGDWSRHGLVAVEWLRDQLPAAALEAIGAHDHRTGLKSETPISCALRLADALAITYDHIGEQLPALLAADAREQLASSLGNRPYLPAMIIANAAALDMPLPILAPIVTTAACRPSFG